MGLTYADLQIMASLYVETFGCVSAPGEKAIVLGVLSYVLTYIFFIEQSQSRKNGLFDDVSEARS